MPQKPSSVVLVSLKVSTYGTDVRLGLSLTAALLDWTFSAFSMQVVAPLAP
jgi:hypothetical protein